MTSRLPASCCIIPAAAARARPTPSQHAPPPLRCASFTLLLSKGYLRTVETVRNRLMVSEWELGLRPIALQL